MVGARWQSHPRGRQANREPRALAGLALDHQIATVPLGHVLDDRQPEAGAAGVARAAGVDAVEALGEARQVLAGDAATVVGHGEFGASVGEGLPAELDAAALRRVANGVVEQVGERAAHFGLGPGDLRDAGVCRRDRVPTGRQPARLALDRPKQRRHRHPLIGGRAWASFELRQGQQVGDQRRHAVGLLAHQRDDALAFGRVEVEAAQRLEKAREHGQRRADLVRDVGDEVAPHRLGSLALGQVLRQHEPGVAGVSPNENRERALAELGGQQHRPLEIAALQVGDKLGRADQVRDALPLVAPRVEAEVVGSAGIAPLDVIRRVEQQHAVGRGLHRRQELGEPLALGLGHARLGS